MYALQTGIMQYLETFKWVAVVPFGTATNPTSTCCPAGSSAADCEVKKGEKKRKKKCGSRGLHTFTNGRLLLTRTTADQSG